MAKAKVTQICVFEAKPKFCGKKIKILPCMVIQYIHIVEILV